METLSPARLSQELRLGTGDDLKLRRIGIALSFAGAAIGAIVGAYQTGVIRRLPDILPGKIWNAEKVDASDYAYENAQMPDGPQMLINYGITAALMAAGGKDRARQAPALPIAALGKTVFDLVLAGVLAKKEWQQNKALCSWCQVATAISAVSIALALPEALKALRRA